jgi:polysaccharide export outer membrane protein
MTLKPTLNQTILYVLVSVFLTLSSCASRQDLVYFQDEPLTEVNTMPSIFELKYKTDDLITIDVTGLDFEAVLPFNLPIVANNNNNILNGQGNLRMQAYLIDAQGNIEFPVLGTIKIAGLTRSEATNMLKEKISEYVKDPIVNIRLANFTVTIIGEVNRPGTFTLQDERITLPEALGLAGDLTIFGKRDNVLLIREIDGVKSFAKIDLTSIDVINSPAYYLTQNDIIVVEPNSARIKSSSFNPNTGIWVGVLGTLATLTAIIITNN